MENKPTTNPNGANQYLLDPRQKLFWDMYIKPGSEFFGNAYQAAMKAGYQETTASQITTEKWFLERLRRLNMLGKAEKVLDKTLDMDAVDQEGKVDSAVLRIQTDVAKHITKTLGKEEGYSERTELTGENGLAIKIESKSVDKMSTDEIDEYLKLKLNESSQESSGK